MACITEKTVADKDEISQELCKILAESAEKAIKERGIFTLGLSGGSMANFACKAISNIKSSNWPAWRLFFCDERLVPLSNADSTLKVYLEGLINQTSLTRETNFIEVKTDLKPEEAAADYESRLKDLFPPMYKWPVFDILLLGAGPDGHTASLFPGHPALDEKEKWVTFITDSPKPPPCRVTLTLPALSHARKAVFAFAGKEKATMVKELRKQLSLSKSAATLPAAKVRPEELLFIMDKAADS